MVDFHKIPYEVESTLLIEFQIIVIKMDTQVCS